MKLTSLIEKIELDVEIGDIILTGKFRNKKTEVKTMSIDKNGQLIINGKKMTNFRTTKRVNIFDEQKLIENPDNFNPDGDENLNYQDNAAPFGISNSKMYVGDKNTTHYKIRPAGYRVQRHEFEYPGRVFFNQKTITFWWFPSPSKLPKVIAQLNKGLKEKKLPTINFSTWNIEVVADKKGDWRKKIKVDWDDNIANESGVKNVIIPLKLYSGSKKRTSTDVGKSHMLSPLLKKMSADKLKRIKHGVSAKQKSMSTKYKFSENIKLIEGRYDKQVSNLTKTTLKHIKGKKTKFEMDIEILGQDVNFTVVVKYTNKSGSVPFAIHGDTSRLNFTFGRYFELGLQIFINNDLFTKNILNDLVAELKEAIRHEIEHVTQHLIRKKPTTIKGTTDLSPYKYLTHRVEVPAMMAGFYSKAKTKKVSMTSVIYDFLKGYVKDLTSKEMKNVITLWTSYGKKKYPTANWK